MPLHLCSTSNHKLFQMMADVDTGKYIDPLWNTVYRCLHGMAPPYLRDGLQRVAELNRRRLRSSTSNALVVPATRLVTVGDRAFPVAGSRLCNSLPTDVTSATTLPVFCSRLKTYLFSVSFPA